MGDGPDVRRASGEPGDWSDIVGVIPPVKLGGGGYINVQWFRGVSVFEAHRLLHQVRYHVRLRASPCYEPAERCRAMGDGPEGLRARGEAGDCSDIVGVIPPV